MRAREQKQERKKPNMSESSKSKGICIVHVPRLLPILTSIVLPVPFVAASVRITLVGVAVSMFRIRVIFNLDIFVM